MKTPKSFYFHPSKTQLARAEKLGVKLPASLRPDLLGALQFDSFLQQLGGECRNWAKACGECAKDEGHSPDMEKSYLDDMVRYAGFAAVADAMRERVGDRQLATNLVMGLREAKRGLTLCCRYFLHTGPQPTPEVMADITGFVDRILAQCEPKPSKSTRRKKGGAS